VICWRPGAEENPGDFPEGSKSEKSGLVIQRFFLVFIPKTSLLLIR
jgi:hypothetical protein